MKKSKSEWPKTIRVGNATVKVYKRITASGNDGFQVVFWDENGKRKFFSFSDETEALKIAHQTAERLSSFGAHVAQTKPSEIATMVAAADMLKPFNVSLIDGAQALNRWLVQHQSLDRIEAALAVCHANVVRTSPTHLNAAAPVAANNRPHYICFRCGWGKEPGQWLVRKTNSLPCRCPHCFSPSWNKPRIRKPKFIKPSVSA